MLKGNFYVNNLDKSYPNRPNLTLFKNPLVISLILCFVLPPVGILFLFMTSLNSIRYALKENRNLPFSLSSFFFFFLLIATVGAALEIKNVYFLLSSVMVLGYWGLYVNTANNTKMNFKSYQWVMIFGAVYNCLIGYVTKYVTIPPLIGFLTGTQLFLRPTPGGYGRLIGSAYNPNLAVYLILIGIAFLLAEIMAAVRKKRFSALLWQISLVILLVNGVIDTGSRSGFLVMCCIFLLFFFRLNKWSFIFVSFISLIQAKWLFNIMPRSAYVNESFKLRDAVWKNSFKLWEQHPIFGVTPIGFRQEYMTLIKKIYTDIPANQLYIFHAHNIFIGFFAAFGIIGGIAFLILLSANIYKSIPLFFSKQKDPVFLEHFLLSLPVIILTGFLDEPLTSPQLALPTIILLAFWDQYTKEFSFVRSSLLLLKNKANSLFLPKIKTDSKNA